MIFWILIAAIAVTMVIVFWNTFEYEGFWGSLGISLLFGVIATLCACLLFGITGAALSIAKQDTWGTTTSKSNLTALNTSSSIEGRTYFLGGGYVKDKRVLNYIENNDGAFYLEQADASESVIHEPDSKPHVVHTSVVGGFWWFAPFPIGTGDQYDFYVPKGSVLSDYQVGN